MASNEEREALEAKANLMGIEFNPRLGDVKLRALIDAVLDPKSVQEETEDEEEYKPAKKNVAPVKKVLTEDEIISQTIGEQRKRLMKLRRVIISCNDPQMKDWETTPPMSISNAILTVPKMVIPLNVEWHVPQWYYEMLKGQDCGIAVKSKDLKGRPITIRKVIKKYNIQDLSDLSNDELIDLKQMQIARDGIK